MVIQEQLKIPDCEPGSLLVNEIFYSIQGEGCHAGEAAVFIRLSKCNCDCPFCDTDFRSYEVMEVSEIINRTVRLTEGVPQERRPWVVITGGEPLLQDLTLLVRGLKSIGYDIALETNGTRPLPEVGFDWVCVSPKLWPVVIPEWEIDEVKWVVTQRLIEFWPEGPPRLASAACILQPVSNKYDELNVCIEWAKKNPLYRIGLQLQRVGGFR